MKKVLLTLQMTKENAVKIEKPIFFPMVKTGKYLAQVGA